MQFLVILIVNIFMGAILYLIISLKLEKSANEFREKKFRKEMDAIIKEFNSTAERNISILESKITVLKRLLEKCGEVKSLDFTVDDSGASLSKNRKSAEIFTDRDWGGEDLAEKTDLNKNDNETSSKQSTGTDEKHGLQLIFDKINRFIPLSKKAESTSPSQEESAEDNEPEISVDIHDEEETESISVSLEKDLSDQTMPIEPAKEEGPQQISEEEIAMLISNADDKYAMIAVLHERGCTIDEISRYSGIPQGEVKLVLNLNSSR